MTNYSDYMDNDLPIPKNNWKAWYKFIGLIAGFVLAAISVALTILNIFL